MTRPVLAAFALLTTLSTGCASEPRREERAPGDGPRADVGHAFDAAARDLEGKLAALGARGWPAHVPLTGTPPRPTARVRPFKNRTREAFDADALRDELVRRLVAQGVVAVAADFEDLEDLEVDEEAAYQSGALQAPVGLVVTGEVVDDLVERDGVKVTTIVVELRLIDAKEGGMLASARAVSRTAD